MKKIIFFTVLLPVWLTAQDFGSMSPEDMQKMQQQAKASQACMQKIDQAEVEKMQVRAEEMAAELRGLCASGDKEKAQAVGAEHARELAADPTIQEVSKCSALITVQIPGLTLPEFGSPNSKEKDVCEFHK